MNEVNQLANRDTKAVDFGAQSATADCNKQLTAGKGNRRPKADVNDGINRSRNRRRDESRKQQRKYYKMSTTVINLVVVFALFVLTPVMLCFCVATVFR